MPHTYTYAHEHTLQAYMKKQHAVCWLCLLQCGQLDNVSGHSVNVGLFLAAVSQFVDVFFFFIPDVDVVVVANVFLPTMLLSTLLLLLMFMILLSSQKPSTYILCAVVVVWSSRIKLKLLISNYTFIEYATFFCPVFFLYATHSYTIAHSLTHSLGHIRSHSLTLSYTHSCTIQSYQYIIRNLKQSNTNNTRCLCTIRPPNDFVCVYVMSLNRAQKIYELLANWRFIALFSNMVPSIISMLLS